MKKTFLISLITAIIGLFSSYGAPPDGTEVALVFLDGVNFDVTINGSLYSSNSPFDYTFNGAGVKVVAVAGDLVSMSLNSNQIRVPGLNNDGFGWFVYKVVNKDANTDMYGINAIHDGSQEFWGEPASNNPAGIMVSRSGDTVYGMQYPDPLFYQGWRFDPVNQPHNRTFQSAWSNTGKVAISFFNYGINADEPAPGYEAPWYP